MGAIFALMVGIDRYQDPGIPNLHGCRADVTRAIASLRERLNADTELIIETLLDEQASGAAVVDGFRNHLAKAGPGDTALFWFSGHGTTEPVPDQFWQLEPDGQIHTLVCADSRVDGRPELLDKEIALLLDELAGNACHVVVVLDSCHSGGATRGERVRAVPPASRKPAYRLVPDLIERYAAGPPPIRHVLLAACAKDQVAREDAKGGYFSRALLQALQQASPSTTYRRLLTLARNEVERRSAAQTPQIFPPGPGLADQRVLGDGTIIDAPAITMRHGRDGWEINVGAAFGVEAFTRFVVDGPAPAPEIVVRSAEVGRSLVEPIGWSAASDQLYPLVMINPPRPTLFGIEGHAGLADLPIGFADPHLRIVEAADAELVLRMKDGGFQLTDRDAQRIADVGANISVSALRHIAKWWRVMTLRNERTAIAHGALLEVVPYITGDVRVPQQRPAEQLGLDGTLRLAYGTENGAPVAPRRFLRLRNTTNRTLYCLVLDLTERFKIYTGLFQPGPIAPGGTAAAFEGDPVYFELPDALVNRPGSSYRDWLVVIASTEPIDPLPYEMDELDLSRRDIRPDRRRSSPPKGDWWTTVLPVVTVGPG